MHRFGVRVSFQLRIIIGSNLIHDRSRNAESGDLAGSWSPSRSCSEGIDHGQEEPDQGEISAKGD